MKRTFLPAICILLAVIGGLFSGDALHGRGPFGSADRMAGDAHAVSGDPGGEGMRPADAKPAIRKGGELAYFRFPTQFFVPVMRGDRLESMMVLTLTLEMPAELQEQVFRQEFRLRDAMLRTLLIHANTGGFDGNFTTEPRMRRLRESLMKTAEEVTDRHITDVLIEDIARQEAV